MNISEVCEIVKGDDKKRIISAVETNRKYMENYPKHNVEALNAMFREWSNVFPSQKQDMNCSSCRNAVYKFWTLVVEEWKASEIVVKSKI